MVIKLSNIRRFYNLTYEHLSLFVMIFGAGAIYITSVLLKSHLSSQEYGYFGLLVTYIGILFGFGLFGVEQVMLRTAQIQSYGKVQLSKTVLLYLMFSVLFGPFLGSFLLASWIPGIPFAVCFMMSVGVALTMLAYNFLRLRSKFIFSQIMANLWKISLSVIFLYSYFSGGNSIKLENMAFVMACVFVISPVCVIIHQYRSGVISLDTSKNGELSLVLAYFVSLGVITLLGSIDRLLVEHFFDSAAFGEYYYRVVLIVMPLNLLSGYIGFKKLVSFKTNFSLAILKHYILWTFIFFVGLSLLILLVVEVGWHFELVKLNISQELSLVMALVFMGVARGINSVVSASVGAIGKAKEIFVANMKTIIIITIAILVMLNDKSGWVVDNRNHIAWMTLVIWAFRIYFMYRCVLRGR